MLILILTYKKGNVNEKEKLERRKVRRPVKVPLLCLVFHLFFICSEKDLQRGNS